jgi:hypothetical protein
MNVTRLLLVSGALLVALTSPAGAVVSGQTDDFQDGTVMGWQEQAGSPNPPTNVADGGPGGIGDRYLENVSSGMAGAGGRMIMFNQAQWTGDYVAAGVTSITGRMASFGTGDGDPSDDPELFVRLAIEGGPNSSRYGSRHAVRLPPSGLWHFFAFDLDAMDGIGNPADSLAEVLGDVDSLRVVSAESGPSWNGDQVAGVLGVDDLTASGAVLTDKGTQPGLAKVLSPPSRCTGCHANYDDVNDPEPHDNWAGTMMANSTRDPLFWAALDVANNDLPGAGDFCLRCHTPVGWLGERSEPMVDGCGLEGTIDGTGQDFDGITCHTCHRLMVNESPPAGEDPFYLENAQLWLDDGDCNGFGEPCRRGPYDYDAGDGTPAPHAWAFSPYHESADICGSCHNVTNPVKTLIEDGVDTTVPFPIERTYAEWSQSDYADDGATPQNCQSCHMPDSTADPVYACIFEFDNRTGDLPVHEFAGGNAWIPEVLAGEYPDLGIEEELLAARDRALDMLQNQSAALDVTVAPQALGGDTLEVEVKVTNLTGHKLPTGYPEGRRMWLHVEARDSTNALVWESGAYDGATGVLTRDGQIKIYEAKQGVWNYNGSEACDTADDLDNPIFHFVLNDCIELDNRIPPLGFTGGDDIETRPVGYHYPETSPGSGKLVNFDVTDYLVPVPEGTVGPVTVTATLRYQTSSKEYIDFLVAQSDEHQFPNDCIDRNGASGPQNMTRAEILEDMWNRYDRSPPVEMASDGGSATVCYALDPTHTGAGADPVASPPASTGCAAGSYLPGENIQLAAAPDEGWIVGGWSGTDDDTGTGTGNTLTMPAAARVVSVSYAIPIDLVLGDSVIDSARLFLACNSITAASGFLVDGPGGDALLRAGNIIALGEGFAVDADGSFSAELDPTLCDPP